MHQTLKSGPSAAMVLLLAASCGIVVGNIYLSQPLVGLIGPAVGLSAQSASAIVSLTQIGYATGLLFLVPLGDLLENRRLIVLTVLTSIPALILAGFAQNGAVMLGAALAIGLTSVAVQMLVPMAAHMAPEHIRGRVVGNVMSGLLFGILLARPISSMVAHLSSWRAPFFLSACLMLGVAALLRFTLPVRQPESRQSYGTLLASVFALPITLPLLRQRGLYQAAVFAGFSLFWTGSPLLLATEFHFSQQGIAIFALVGAAGAFAAPIAGRLADRGLAYPGTISALLAVVASFGIAWAGAALHSIVLLALAGVVLDAGVQVNLVFGQRAIYTLAPEIRSRLNGVFMAIFFAGGAAGSALTSPVLAQFGWPGLCAIGAILPVLALIYFLAVTRPVLKT